MKPADPVFPRGIPPFGDGGSAGISTETIVEKDNGFIYPDGWIGGTGA